jgi:hypothetical protein
LPRARAVVGPVGTSISSPFCAKSKRVITSRMTKRRVGVSSGNWFEGSQVSKARPGAPFDFTLQYCRGHKLVIALPTRFSESAARDDKGKGLGSIESGCWGATFSPLTTLHTRVTLSFVIPSAAEGSAVPRTLSGNAESHLPQPCHLGPRRAVGPEQREVERSAVSFLDEATRTPGHPACSRFSGALPPQASIQTA